MDKNAMYMWFVCLILWYEFYSSIGNELDRKPVSREAPQTQHKFARNRFFVKFRLGGWALKYILINTCTIHLYIERHKDGRGRYALEFWYAETQTECFLCLRSLCLKFRFRRYFWFDCVHHMEFSYICICISCPIKRI